MAISPGSALPVLVFGVILIAYTAQTELAQYVQQTLGYRQPFFLFWLTHSGYVLLLPLHVLALAGLPGQGSVGQSLRLLRAVLSHHFATTKSSADADPTQLGRTLSRGTLPDVGGGRRPRGRRMSMRKLLSKTGVRGIRRGEKNRWKWNLGTVTLKLSVLIAIPSCTWYIATPLTSMTEITAIYNVFAFWAYVLAIKMLGEPASTFKLASVLMAILGVLVISFGGAAMEDSAQPKTGSHPLIGDLLALIGSLSFAYYEIWYKIHVSLHEPAPKDEMEEGVLDALLATEEEEEDAVEPSSPPSGSSTAPPRPARTRESSSRSVLSIAASDRDVTHPSSSTVLLYSNAITTLIGLATLGLLWFPIPILHYTGGEPFKLPPGEAILPIVGIVLTGVAFNGGFMLLISIWGPLVASVGNLCTLLLVALADTIITGVPLPWTTLLGSGMVCGAFAGLIVAARAEAQSTPSPEQELGKGSAEP